MKHCVMFDFDGVIVDSERYALELLQGIRPRGKARVVLYEPAVCKAAYRPVRGQLLQRGLSPLVHLGIGRLPSLGYKVGLVSSTRSLHILYALDRLRMVRLFDFIITGDMVSRSKPAPDPYLKGIAFSGCQADECIVVEDSPAGVKAAKDAGIFTIGFKAASIRLDTSLADIEIGSYKELEGYLEGLAR